jgi:hypothetical protein
MRFRVYSLLSVVGIVGWFVNLRPSGALRWKAEDRLLGQCDVEGRHLQGCTPHLCQLRTDGLAPMSKY